MQQEDKLRLSGARNDGMPSHLEMFPPRPLLSSSYPQKRCSAAQQPGWSSSAATHMGTYIAVQGYLAVGCPRSPAHLAGMDAFRNESKASTLDLRHHSVHLSARSSSNIHHRPTPKLPSARRSTRTRLPPAPELDGHCELMGSPPCRPTQA